MTGRPARMKTPAVYKRERLNESAKRKQQRVARNTARQRAIKKGQADVGDGTHVGHKEPLSGKGGNSESNTEVVSAESNMKKYNRAADGTRRARKKPRTTPRKRRSRRGA